jgi:hypothetical protein
MRKLAQLALIIPLAIPADRAAEPPRAGFAMRLGMEVIPGGRGQLIAVANLEAGDHRKKRPGSPFIVAARVRDLVEPQTRSCPRTVGREE